MGAPAVLGHGAQAWLARFPVAVVERAVLPGAGSGTEAGEGEGELRGLHARTVVMLTHGGPRMADAHRERPVGPAESADPITGRTPSALDGPGWEGVVDAFVGGAEEALRWGAWAVGVEAARGQLWHAALSPLTGGQGAVDGTALGRLCGLVRRLGTLGPRVAVSLCVEDVAVGGIHPAQGVRIARELVAAGASALIVRTGCAFSPARLVPPVPRFPHEEGPSLHAADWVRHAVPLDVMVAVAGAMHSAEVAQAAVAGGLCDAVVVEAWE